MINTINGIIAYTISFLFLKSNSKLALSKDQLRSKLKFQSCSVTNALTYLFYGLYQQFADAVDESMFCHKMGRERRPTRRIFMAFSAANITRKNKMILLT